MPDRTLRIEGLGLKRIWVTGASGFLGSEVCRLARDQEPKLEIFGLVHSNSASMPVDFPCTVLPIDLTSHSRVEREFSKTSPDAVFHLAAAPDANWVEQNPEASFSINVTASVFLARLCAQRGIPLLFASSDLIFDGRKAPYGERSSPSAPSLYGRQKAEAERLLFQHYPDGAIVCRLPLMYGPPSPAGKSTQQGITDALFHGKKTRLFIDEFRTPVSTRSAAEGLFLALRTKPRVIHLGGRERLSRYDFGIRLAHWLGKKPDNLLPAFQKEIRMAAPRPPDVSLDSRMAFSIGYDPRPLEDEWARIPWFRELRAAS